MSLSGWTALTSMNITFHLTLSSCWEFNVGGWLTRGLCCVSCQLRTSLQSHRWVQTERYFMLQVYVSLCYIFYVSVVTLVRVSYIYAPKPLGLAQEDLLMWKETNTHIWWKCQPWANLWFGETFTADIISWWLGCPSNRLLRIPDKLQHVSITTALVVAWWEHLAWLSTLGHTKEL